MSVYQDWNTVTIGNGNANGNKKKVNNTTVQYKKPNPLDSNEDMPPKIQCWTHELITALQQARQAKNLKQSDLAKQLSIPVHVIQGIENNTSPYDKKSYSNIMRKLGVDLKTINFPVV
jgi:ribosome-binding protein aMBF1 (putative translation factor)